MKQIISPELYDARYFLNDCEGHQLFAKSQGRALSPRLAKVLHLVAPKPGMVVLDIGSGRGEIALACARHGAIALGIDYSSVALRIADQTSEQSPLSPHGKAVFVQGDASALPLTGQSCDVAVMSDVVEHIPDAIMDVVLREVHRVLKPGAIVVVHTLPNRWFYDYGYPLKRALARLTREQLPEDPRTNYEHQLHVNEQSPVDLWHSLKKHFLTALWLEPPGQVSSRLVLRLSPLNPIRLLFCNDLWAIGYKTPTSSNGLVKLSQEWLCQWKTAGQIRFRPTTAPKRITMAEDDSTYLVEGWYAPDGDYTPFRWTHRRATAFLATESSSKYISIEARHGRPNPRWFPLRVRLKIDGRLLAEYTLEDNDWRRLRCQIPLEARDCIIRFEMEVNRTWRPAAVLKNRDPRELGLCIRGIWVD